MTDDGTEDSGTTPADPATLTDASPSDPVAPGVGEAEEAPWYEEAGLPWRHKPTKRDLACWTSIMVVTVYSVVVVIFRPRLITWSPALAAAITGGRSSVVATGAFARVDGDSMAFVGLIWVVAAVSLVKWSWVYWWAGHLWGEAILDIWAGQTERSKRRAARAVRVAQRYWWLAVFLTFLPLPFPMPVVFAAIGAAGVPLKRFVVPVLGSSLVLQAV
ncbi:MAG: VTT domain-containing protein, partial [Propionibacteriaceae bacterium]|nr:VTT domain-containing protein [Propionibacteriaceae bacterium]